jgi:hypothetical protein
MMDVVKLVAESETGSRGVLLILVDKGLPSSMA